MIKNRWTSRMLPIVLIGVVAGLITRLARPAQAATTEAVGPERSQTPPPIDQELLARRAAQRQAAASLDWTRDPFSASTERNANGLSLSGILWDPRDAMAIINGRTVRVGDRFDGYQVLQIQQDRVVLSNGSETLQLRTSQ